MRNNNGPVPWSALRVLIIAGLNWLWLVDIHDVLELAVHEAVRTLRDDEGTHERRLAILSRLFHPHSA